MGTSVHHGICALTFGALLITTTAPGAAAPVKPKPGPVIRPVPKPKPKPKPAPMLPPHKRPPPKAEGMAKIFSIDSANKGFYDDPIAFARDGSTVAAIRTDGATFITLELFTLPKPGEPAPAGKPQPARTIDLMPFTLTPTALRFLDDGQSLWVKAREGEADARMYKAQIYGPDGKVTASFGPATDIAMTDSDPTVVVWNERPTKAGLSYEVVATHAATGKQVARRTLSTDEEGVVRGTDFVMLFFSNDYLTIYGKQKGGFDKKKDMRLPDAYARYDVRAGKVAQSTVIQDVLGHQRRMKLKKDFPWPAFVRVKENLQGLELFTPDDRAVELELASDWIRYDSQSVQQRLSDSDKVLTFSVTIDPVNILAVDKKVADVDFIDFYVAADVSVAKATRVGRLPANKRPFTWRSAGSLFAVLRKHRGFDRGGPEVEIYQLTATSK